MFANILHKSLSIMLHINNYYIVDCNYDVLSGIRTVITITT